jgi:regulator of sirC expression with transglutaminase-like and TPR domain
MLRQNKWFLGSAALLFSVILLLMAAAPRAYASNAANAQTQSQIEALFAGNRDMAEIKLTIDRMTDPTVDVAEGLEEISRLKTDLARMATGETDSLARLAVLKRFVYEAGPWNQGKPFQYDLTDPTGQKPGNRLLTDYLADRHGNCVSMPILFMVLGQHMGLKMTLAQAPLHLLVKFTDDQGREWNLETTSGAGLTRDSHYRKLLPMSDEAVASGLYLRGLSRDEVIGVLATELVSHFLQQGRFEDAIVASDVILKHAPKSADVLIKRGSSYAGILRRDIISRYKSMSEMDPETKAYADGLYQANLADFAAAEALGWREQDGQL